VCKPDTHGRDLLCFFSPPGGEFLIAGLGNSSPPKIREASRGGNGGGAGGGPPGTKGTGILSRGHRPQEATAKESENQASAVV